MQAASLDDDEFFDDVYGKHHAAVYAYLVGRSKDRDAAADLLQETFVRVWQHLGSVRAVNSSNRLFYLLAVARSVTSRYHGRLARANEFTLEVDVPTGTDEYAKRDQIADLDRAMGQLPEEQREVLSLTVLGGLSSQEIGLALGRPAGTVRYILMQARKNLAGTMQLESCE